MTAPASLKNLGLLDLERTNQKRAGIGNYMEKTP